MVFSSGNFTLLLQTMGLVQGIRRPTPSHSTSTPPAKGAKAPVSWVHSQFAGTDSQSPGQDLPSVHINSQSGDCSVQPYEGPDLSDLAFAPFERSKATVFRYRQQQSVNLGSWFVHEQWMTPSLFTCASGKQLSELDIASGWGSLDSARAVLERHWDTFINASDFHYLSSIGINTVRLPIGYWSLGPAFCQGTPFEPVADVYRNSWPRVVRAINDAADAGIGVLVDLHGAPGSQNGQQHSGISDGQTNLFGNDWYTNKSMAVLSFLMQELVNVTNVVGIQILNEPTNAPELPSFYLDAIATMRAISPAAQAFPLYIHDGFNLEQFSWLISNRTDFVVEDHHSYFVFTPQDDSEPASQHTSDVRYSIADSLAAASYRNKRNLIIGEFSCALTDQSLEGEKDPEEARREFCTGQTDIYQNTTAGWAFWAYDKEQCSDDPGWCFKAAVGRSLPSSFFSYGNGSIADPSRLPVLADVASSIGAPLPQSSPSTSSGPTPSAPPQVLLDPNGAVGVFPVQRRSRLNANMVHRRGDRGALPLRQRDNSAANQLPLDPTQRAMAKGYSDGFMTAKIFALYGMSKLGFTGQYINDSLDRLGKAVIASSTEHYYEQRFIEGLRDGETLITSSI